MWRVNDTVFIRTSKSGWNIQSRTALKAPFQTLKSLNEDQELKTDIIILVSFCKLQNFCWKVVLVKLQSVFAKTERSGTKFTNSDLKKNYVVKCTAFQP